MNKLKLSPRTLSALTVFSIFAVYIGYAIFNIAYLILNESKKPNTLGSYYLIIIKAILGIVCITFPFIAENKLKITLPNYLFISYISFIFSTIFLGEILHFYNLIHSWDIILHFSSGIMFSAFFCFFIKEKIPNLSMRYILFFVFCFAVASGTIWEIFEFLNDIIFGSNMQRYALSTGIPLVGQAALKDTMTDLIMDTTGSLTFIIYNIFKKRIILKRKSNLN